MIPISRPVMGEPEIEAARRVIESGWTTQGPEVLAFEEEFARSVGAPYACAVSSCTTALHLALLVVGVRPGDEVVLPSHSFIATANAVRYCGATPVFVDIEPDTFNLDPVQVERAISSRTRALLAVHQMGLPADLRRLLAVARRFELPLVEDAACAAGSEILWNGQWQRIGRPHGDLACFSFHPRKVISTGDGGMVTTHRADWDRRLRLLRQHGMSVPDTARHAATQVIFEQYPVVGFNYRMTDLQAGVGRAQLQRLPSLVHERRAQARRYDELLAQVPGLERPREPNYARSNWQSYCVRLPEGVPQRQTMQAMLDAGIATRRGILCSHREPAYAGVATPHPLVHSEAAQDRCILLPLYPGLSGHEQHRVAEALARACAKTPARAAA